jgi:hypothetical protein
MRACAVALGLFALAAFGWACESGEPATGCKSDRDCPTGARCVSSTGVCVDFRNPDDASIPDLAGPDLLSADALAD